MPPKDNLTESLYRRRPLKKPVRRNSVPRRRRNGRTMALDAFFVATLVLVFCMALLQFFLIGWLEFF